MAWTCPKCKRRLAVKTKEHSCVTISPESHFEGKPAALKKIYDKLKDAVSDLGEVNVQAVKGSIYFKKTGTFAGVMVRKDHLKVEFFLPRVHDAFPVEKTFYYSPKKVVHVVSVSEPGDINKQLLAWIGESYSLAK